MVHVTALGRFNLHSSGFKIEPVVAEGDTGHHTGSAVPMSPFHVLSKT